MSKKFLMKLFSESFQNFSSKKQWMLNKGKCQGSVDINFVKTENVSDQFLELQEVI